VPYGLALGARLPKTGTGVSVCLCVCLSLCLSVYTCSSVYLNCLSVCHYMSVGRSTCVYAYISVSLSECRSSLSLSLSSALARAHTHKHKQTHLPTHTHTQNRYRRQCHTTMNGWLRIFRFQVLRSPPSLLS
jgi:hypothetical protein